jgi:hypothetical protein
LVQRRTFWMASFLTKISTYRVFIQTSGQSWRWRVDCEHTKNYGSQINFLNLTFLHEWSVHNRLLNVNPDGKFKWTPDIYSHWNVKYSQVHIYNYLKRCRIGWNSRTWPQTLTPTTMVQFFIKICSCPLGYLPCE